MPLLLCLPLIRAPQVNTLGEVLDSPISFSRKCLFFSRIASFLRPSLVRPSATSDVMRPNPRVSPSLSSLSCRSSLSLVHDLVLSVGIGRSCGPRQPFFIVNFFEASPADREYHGVVSHGALPILCLRPFVAERPAGVFNELPSQIPKECGDISQNLDCSRRSCVFRFQ